MIPGSKGKPKQNTDESYEGNMRIGFSLTQQQFGFLARLGGGLEANLEGTRSGITQRTIRMPRSRKKQIYGYLL